MFPPAAGCYPYRNKVTIEIAFDKEADNLFDEAVKETPSKEEVFVGNLLPGDTGFETGVMDESWHVINGFEPPSINNTTAADGKSSLKIGKGGISGSLNFYLPWGFIEDGETYTLSAYLKSKEPGKGFFRVGLADGFRWHRFDVTTSWKRYVFTMPEVENKKQGHSRIIIKATTLPYWIDGVQLEKGNKATTYRPQDDVVFTLIKDNPGRTYFKDELKRLSFNFYNPKPEERHLSFIYSIKDYYGKVIKKGEVPLTLSPKGSDSIKLSLNPGKNGLFICNCKISEKGEEIVKKAETFCILPYTEKEVKEKDLFFGNHGGYFGVSSKEAERFSRIGVGTVRTGVLWCILEKEKGKFNWTDFDRAVSSYNSYNIDLMAIIKATPPWAAVNGKWGGLPKVKDFGEFIYKLMERYKGKIKYLELFNEPDHFAADARWGKYISSGVITKSRAEYYADLTKEAYINAKKADPNCKVLAYGAAGAGYNWWLNRGGKKFADGYMPLAKDYFDIFTGHYYGTGVFGPGSRGIIRDTGIKQRLKTTVDYFKSHGYKKEMWAGEQGWRLDIYVPFDSIYAKEHARATTKTLVQTRSFPEFKRYLSFRDQGARASKYDYCLWKEGYRPLPAVSAYATTAWLLKNVGDGKELDLHTEDIEGYIFPREEENISVLWMNSTDKGRVVLPSDANVKIEVIDYMGNSVFVQKGEKGIQFELGRDPVFIKSKDISFSSMKRILEEGISLDEPLKIKVSSTKSLSDVSVSLTSHCKEKLYGKIKLEITPYQKIAFPEKEFSLLPYETKPMQFEIINPDFEKMRDAALKTTAVITGRKPIIATTKRVLYSCPQKNIKIDGELKDWETISSFKMDVPESYKTAAPKNRKDYSPQCFLSWDKEHLYFAAEVIDDKVSCNDTETGDFQHSDHYIINLDTKNNASEESETFDDDDYVFSFIPAGPEGKPMVKEGSKYFGGPGHPELNIEKIKIVSDIKSDRWKLEVAIPWDMLNITPVKGMILGISFRGGDTDNKRRKYISHWGKEEGKYWQNPNTCRDICFW